MQNFLQMTFELPPLQFFRFFDWLSWLQVFFSKVLKIVEAV
jgi:hypothetical protein